MSKSPIFIHSLFRAGSTYLFNVFRRSGAGYWCYQEPLHELAVFARDEPKLLLVDHGEEKTRLLRHPKTEKMYFQELYDTWPAWQEALSAFAVYNGYFAPPHADIGIPYWSALIDAAQGRPVLQECRTAGRIGAIQDQLGGYHIYLWRNPWDQWWSYKVTPYFDVANQLIINAPYSPPAVHALRAALGLEAYAGDGLGEAFAHFSEKPRTSEENYLIFYLLWCLGLQAGAKHAHLMLNIDRLSDSPTYRDEMQTQLTEAGIDGIDFSDCHVPQGRHLEQDQAFFTALEDKVHHWLKEGGWSQNELDHVYSLRQQFLPASWSESIAALDPQDLAEQASRARTLTRRFESNVAEIARVGAAKIAQAEAKADQAEAKANQAEAKADQAEANFVGLLNSKSWRLTAPLRWLGRMVRRITAKSLKGHLKALIRKVAGYAARHPPFRQAAINMLNHSPSLKARLKRVIYGGAMQMQPLRDVPIDVSELTPRARMIYGDLKAAIARRKRENR